MGSCRNFFFLKKTARLDLRAKEEKMWWVIVFILGVAFFFWCDYESEGHSWGRPDSGARTSSNGW